jgi:hypothetical protein
MNDIKRSSHQHGEPARDSIRHDGEPYWKRAHRDWRVWVALCFMMAAITIYVLSDDLSFFPHAQMRQSVSTPAGK